MIGSAKAVLATVGAAALAAATMGQAGEPAPAASPPAAFSQCAACHSAKRGASAGVGPNLWGVVGAKAGARPGFDYSAALKGSKIVWTKAALVKWIADPAKLAPGTTMPPPGVTRPADQAAIANYLATLK